MRHETASTFAFYVDFQKQKCYIIEKEQPPKWLTSMQDL